MKISFRSSSFIKAIMTLMSGSIIAQAVTLLLSPLLSRLFTPAELGVYTVLQSCVSMFSAILSWRYDMVIVTEQNEKHVNSLVVLATGLCIISSVLVTGGCGIYLTIKQVKGLNVWVGCCFILISSLMTGMINILTAYNNKLREYKVISTTYVIRTTIQNSLMVLSGLVKSGANGLLFSSALGLICGVNKQWQSLRKNMTQLKHVNWQDLFRVACIHKKQALVLAPAIFMNGFFYSGLNLLVEGLYGTQALGLFSYSNRILVLPIVLISANISRVFMEYAAKEWNEHGSFKKTYFQTLLLISAVAIPIWIILKCASPWLFEFVFGSLWREAGVYVQLLVTMFMLRLIAGCVNGAAVIAGKQTYDLFVQFALVASLVVGGIIAHYARWNIVTFFRYVNFFSSIIYGIYIILFCICAHGKRERI